MLAVEGTRLYVVDYWETQVHIFDISNPASLNLVGTYIPSTSGRIINIAVEDDILYMARDADGLEIVDCSNPASPAYLTTYGGTDLNGGKIWDVDAADGFVFLPLHSTGEIQVLDVSTPSAPVLFFSDTILQSADQTVRNIEHLHAGSFHATDVVAVVGFPNDRAAAGYDIAIDFYSWNPGNTGSEFTWIGWVQVNASSFSIWSEALFEDQAYFAFGSAGTVAIGIAGITTGTAPTGEFVPTGKFAARSVAVSPADRSILVAESYGVYAFDADAGLAGFAVATDTSQSPEMTLAPAAYITSSIIDKNGDPQAEVPVHFQVGPVGEDAGTRTHTFAATPSDENGQVRVGLVPTGIPIRLLPDPEIAKWAGELTWEKAGAFTLDAGEQRELPPLRLNLAGRTVGGEVCNEQGEAVAGARIVVCESGDVVQADADGRFELGGLPMQETAGIVAIHPTESLYAAVALYPSHDVVPTLILGPPGSITGQVTDAKGNPIAEQEVSVSARTASSIEALLPQAALRQTVHTDAEGSFSVEGLVAGLWYNIVAFHPDYEPGVWTFARTKPGETVDLGQLRVESAEPPEPPTIYYGPSDWTPPAPSAPRSP